MLDLVFLLSEISVLHDLFCTRRATHVVSNTKIKFMDHRSINDPALRIASEHDFVNLEMVLLL